MRYVSLLLLSTVVSIAWSGSADAQVGSVLRSARIGQGLGGFPGTLGEEDYFGWSTAPLGDQNGDGVPDLAVGERGDDDGGLDRGAVWFLHLTSDGAVSSASKISQTRGGFGGALADGSEFGSALASVGDLDGDGRAELAVSCHEPERLWILFPNADGTLHGETEIRFSDPVFGGRVDARDIQIGTFGSLGDLDGDGFVELAIGAPHEDDNAGALWILRLQSDGTSKAAQRIAEGVGGFTADLARDRGRLGLGDQFGSAISRLGDLDGDGHAELAVSGGGGRFGLWILYLDANGLVRTNVEFDVFAYLPEFANAYVRGPGVWLGDLDGNGSGEWALDASYSGALVIASLRADGSVRRHLSIRKGRGGLGEVPLGSGFGFRPSLIGDLDGDGTPEVAVGAPYENLGRRREDVGSVWILSLDVDSVRNGSGVNPLTLTQQREPVSGSTWRVTLDCSGHAPGVAAIWGFDRPTSGVFTPYGEVLITGAQVFYLRRAHSSGPTVFEGMVPPVSTALLALPIFVQGACTGAPGPQLSNALDVVIGAPARGPRAETR